MFILLIGCFVYRLLGNNPYDCGCPAIDFWIYHNESNAADIQYIDSTSSMLCATPERLNSQILYEIEYPHCGK